MAGRSLVRAASSCPRPLHVAAPTALSQWGDHACACAFALFVRGAWPMGLPHWSLRQSPFDFGQWGRPHPWDCACASWDLANGNHIGPRLRPCPIAIGQWGLR